MYYVNSEFCTSYIFLRVIFTIYSHYIFLGLIGQVGMNVILHDFHMRECLGRIRTKEHGMMSTMKRITLITVHFL